MAPLDIAQLVDRFVSDLPPGTCRFVLETNNQEIMGIRADCWDASTQGHYGLCHYSFWEVKKDGEGTKQVSHGFDATQLPTHFREALTDWLGQRFNKDDL